MKNLNLLFSQNTTSGSFKRIPLVNKRVVFRSSSGKLNLDTIRYILDFISKVRNKLGNTPIPLCFDLGAIELEDKLSITLLECIMYYLCLNKHSVVLRYETKTSILTEGINSSPLRFLKANSKQYNLHLFVERFRRDISLKHYRLIIPSQAAETEELSKKMGDIRFFFRHGLPEKAHYDEIVEVIAELIGNACEHDKSDCLVDIDISQTYEKRNASGTYKGINISIISFTSIGFGTALKMKILDEEDETPRYATVKNAYINHGVFFDEEYCEDDFFIITAFQDRITSRKNEYNSGGTGLTLLLQSIEESADADLCYLLTNKRKLWFKASYLDYDKDGWNGFNQQKNYEKYPPEKSLLDKSSFQMPGTAYSLNFVMKVEETDNAVD